MKPSPLVEASSLRLGSVAIRVDPAAARSDRRCVPATPRECCGQPRPWLARPPPRPQEHSSEQAIAGGSGHKSASQLRPPARHSPRRCCPASMRAQVVAASRPHGPRSVGIEKLLQGAKTQAAASFQRSVANQADGRRARHSSAEGGRQAGVPGPAGLLKASPASPRFQSAGRTLA